MGILNLPMTFSSRIFHRTSKNVNTSDSETEFLLLQRAWFFFFSYPRVVMHGNQLLQAKNPSESFGD